jgi:hypothetical protein
MIIPGLRGMARRDYTRIPPLGSEGIPYVLDAFELEGTATLLTRSL